MTCVVWLPSKYVTIDTLAEAMARATTGCDADPPNGSSAELHFYSAIHEHRDKIKRLYNFGGLDARVGGTLVRVQFGMPHVDRVLFYVDDLRASKALCDGLFAFEVMSDDEAEARYLLCLPKREADIWRQAVQRGSCDRLIAFPCAPDEPERFYTLGGFSDEVTARLKRWRDGFYLKAEAAQVIADCHRGVDPIALRAEMESAIHAHALKVRINGFELAPDLVPDGRGWHLCLWASDVNDWLSATGAKWQLRYPYSEAEEKAPAAPKRPAQKPAMAEPIAASGPLPLPTPDAALLFDTLYWDKSRWGSELADAPLWVRGARVCVGTRGGVAATWNPVLLALSLIEHTKSKRQAVTTEKVTERFRYCAQHGLVPGIEDWQSAWASVATFGA